MPGESQGKQDEILNALIAQSAEMPEQVEVNNVKEWFASAIPDDFQKLSEEIFASIFHSARNLPPTFIENFYFLSHLAEYYYIVGHRDKEGSLIILANRFHELLRKFQDIGFAEYNLLLHYQEISNDVLKVILLNSSADEWSLLSSALKLRYPGLEQGRGNLITAWQGAGYPDPSADIKNVLADYQEKRDIFNEHLSYFERYKKEEHNDDKPSVKFKLRQDRVKNSFSLLHNRLNTAAQTYFSRRKAFYELLNEILGCIRRGIDADHKGLYFASAEDQTLYQENVEALRRFSRNCTDNSNIVFVLQTLDSLAEDMDIKHNVMRRTQHAAREFNSHINRFDEFSGSFDEIKQKNAKRQASCFHDDLVKLKQDIDKLQDDAEVKSEIYIAMNDLLKEMEIVYGTSSSSVEEPSSTYSEQGKIAEPSKAFYQAAANVVKLANKIEGHPNRYGQVAVGMVALVGALLLIVACMAMPALLTCVPAVSVEVALVAAKLSVVAPALANVSAFSIVMAGLSSACLTVAGLEFMSGRLFGRQGLSKKVFGVQKAAKALCKISR
ncbi:MAG TPA: hypothetical protein VNC84_05355 [Gammaproteobacteria bacterium]|jgi:hypothetical protein|nr:hypothetical protein [Gammaproteobacteria bacterium]